MRREESIKYRVAPLSGLTHFPWDMLRYDGAFPAAERDSATIEGYVLRASTERKERRPVELVAVYNGSPSDPRWRSFGWHVTDVWNGAEWESYDSSKPSHRLAKE